jgi:hypothetical protein
MSQMDRQVFGKLNLDQTDILGRTVKDFEHRELEGEEPDFMFAILFEASIENHQDDNDFDFKDAIFLEKAGDHFENFDDFKAHQIKKVQVEMILSRKQQQSMKK